MLAGSGTTSVSGRFSGNARLFGADGLMLVVADAVVARARVAKDALIPIVSAATVATVAPYFMG
jgi:hypothetical protein